MRLALGSLSLRAKLALILGFTIFALAGTRALGLSQLGAFLDRFDGYTRSAEAVHRASSLGAEAQWALERQVIAARLAGAEAAANATATVEGAMAALQEAVAAAGLGTQEAAALRARIRTAGMPEGASEHPEAQALRELRNRISRSGREVLATARAAHAREVRIMTTTYVTMLVLVLAAGLAAYVLIARMVTRPLGRMVEVANAVASGDLRSRIDTSRGDELGQVMRSLDHMNRGLVSLIRRVDDSSAAMRTASETIEQSNSGLAERVTAQSATIEETVSAMDELVAAVARNAENARTAGDRAAEASRIAEQGGQDLGRVTETMGSIAASARRVTDITATIDAIAFQTNLLSLNAAVEAARAGESGRGFAVVATEVRALARKSAAAAREVKELIDDALRRVDSGAAAVKSADETMARIVASAKDATGVVHEIASVSADQAAALQQVNAAMARMDERARHNAEVVEAAAGCARDLRVQAAALHEAVAAFTWEAEGDLPPEPVSGPAHAGAPALPLAPAAWRRAAP